MRFAHRRIGVRAFPPGRGYLSDPPSYVLMESGHGRSTVTLNDCTKRQPDIIIPRSTEDIVLRWSVRPSVCLSHFLRGLAQTYSPFYLWYPNEILYTDRGSFREVPFVGFGTIRRKLRLWWVAKVPPNARVCHFVHTYSPFYLSYPNQIWYTDRRSFREVPFVGFGTIW